MDNKGKFKIGTQFIGNVNGVKMEVVKTENPWWVRNRDTMVTIKDLGTGKTFLCGLRTLEKCDVTILEQ